MNSAPVNDWFLFDLFTTAPNQNATRGQLSINQTGLAAWSALLGGVIVLTNTSTDENLDEVPPLVTFNPINIEPAGVFDPYSPNLWPPLARIVNAINSVRATNVNYRGTFPRLGDILAVPELTVASPFLNQNSALQMQRGINDAVYERIPQQILSLLQVGEPRFVIYAYGQALKPADRSIVTSGPFFGLCTNYQITAEVATRTVIRVAGNPDPNNVNHPDPLKRYPPHIVVESFNTLPPD